MLKITFWKHKLEIYVYFTFFLPVSLGLFLAGLILTIQDAENFWPLLVLGIFILFCIIIIFFDEKRIVAKVIFSDDGIEWRWFKKTILFIDWTEITDITTRFRGRGNYDLSFIANDKRIDVWLTKKIYNTIIIICPEPNVKMQINNLKEFEWCHNKDN